MQRKLGGADLEKDVQTFCIVNKVDQTLTGNLRGPLLINSLTRVGFQFCSTSQSHQVRHPLVVLKAREAMKFARL
jgi:flagellar assembly factor FliW